MRVEAYMQARRVEQLLVIGVVVGAHPKDETPMVAVVEGIFGKNAWHMFYAPVEAIGQNLVKMPALGATQVFLVLVVGIAGAHRILVHLVDNV